LHSVAASAAMRRVNVALNASLAAASDLQFTKTKTHLCRLNILMFIFSFLRSDNEASNGTFLLKKEK
jgi:hypothetical protein